MRNVFDCLMEKYDEEYEFVCSYFKDFGLHDRVRILKDIKSFPEYVHKVVMSQLHPREISDDAIQMICEMQMRWKFIHGNIRKS